MARKELSVNQVVALYILGLALGSTWGCAGPQALSVAIRKEDARAYEEAIAFHAGSPKEVFFTRKAARTSRSRDEIEAADRRLSMTRNPFNARRDREAVSRGAVIYRYHCMECHGERADGRGPTIKYPQATMNSHAFGKRFAATLHGGAPRTWFRKIHDGYTSEVVNEDGTRNAMPPFKDILAREQIWLAITYFQSLDIDADAAEKPPR